MGPPARPWLLRGASMPAWRLGGLPPPETCIGTPAKIRPARYTRALGGYRSHPAATSEGEYVCVSLEDFATAQASTDARPAHPIVHRIKEVFMTMKDTAFPAQDALVRRTRQLVSPVEPLPAPLLVDVSTGGASAPVAAGTGSSDEVAGQSPAAEARFYARGDLPSSCLHP